MAKEHKLPKPASCATDEELANYLAQFDPSGDRRVLSEELLRLRKLADGMFEDLGTGDWDKAIRTAKPVTEAAKIKVDNDNALI
jgi:hypothetical protein